METVYIASYKGIRPGWHGIVNRIIRTLDSTEYSHTEVCIGNPFENVVPCYSASGVDKGVRVKYMKLDPENWDVICVPFVYDEEVIKLYNRTVGHPYDYFGTGRFAFPWMLREHPYKYFCSEWAGEAMKIEGPWRLSPATIKNIGLSMGGYEVYPLEN